ncbi:DDB1- and CUL4-associated factor 6-like isoform X2 [Corticium candelabrum]|nr:DDB1- and CUL4-associated factor 6-like isoform X2 [Corticium candelabrum]
MPNTNDSRIVSCAGDGTLHYTEVEFESTWGTMPFNCHGGTTYQVLTTPNDSYEFLSCSEDGTVRRFDLRVKKRCLCEECHEDVLLDLHMPVMAISSNPFLPYHLAVGLNDSTVRLFDRRMITSIHPRPFSIFCPPQLKDKPTRVTSIQYSHDGQEVLVSYSTDYIYLFSPLDEYNPLLFVDEQTSHIPTLEEQEEIITSDNVVSQASLRRLRLRGDWSDTGPDARPTNDQQESSNEQQSLLERVSTAFTRWIGEQLSHDDSHSDSEEETRLLSCSVSSASSSNVMNDDTTEADTNGDMMHSATSGMNDSYVSMAVAEATNYVGDHTKRTGNDTATDEQTEVVAMCNHVSGTLQTVKKNTTHNTSDTLDTLPSDVSHRDDIDNMHDDGDNTAIAGMSVDTHEINGVRVCSQDGDKRQAPTELLDNTENVQDGDSNDRECDRMDDGDLVLKQEAAARRIQQAFRLHMQDTVAYLNNGEAECVIRPRVSMMYRGHRNARTMIKEVNFWGHNYVMSGSDCGRIFFWHKQTGRLVNLLLGDRHVVNCLQPHPYHPVLASSGIDHNVKIWSPLLKEARDMGNVTKVVALNEQMLSENRQTLTIPAGLMIRMMAAISRRNRQHQDNAQQTEQNQDEGSGDET